jgi:tripartite-type tricarboxylate transporter receptor subunit TctC
MAAVPFSVEDYLARPVTIIVPTTAGGGTDILSRIVGEQLSKQLGQPFVVQNLPGAGRVTGTEVAAKAAPDGYTLQTGLTANMAVKASCERSPSGFFGKNRRWVGRDRATRPRSVRKG